MRYHANTAVKRNSIYDVALDELESCLISPVTVETELSAKELGSIIDRFLDTLDHKNRVIFVRRYWYADPVSDIAARMRMRPNNVSVRLSRTREKLRTYLRTEGYTI
jgi:RNA polymerase sigma-70 factor (ECF subfamily)